MRTYLREWREWKGLKLEQAARKIGLSDHTALSKIERGKRRYNQTILENLAKLYGTDPGTLLNRPPGVPEDEIRHLVEQLPNPEQGIELLKTLIRTTPQ